MPWPWGRGLPIWLWPWTTRNPRGSWPVGNLLYRDSSAGRQQHRRGRFGGRRAKEIPVRDFINKTKKIIRMTYDAILEDELEQEKSALAIGSDALGLKHAMTSMMKTRANFRFRTESTWANCSTRPLIISNKPKSMPEIRCSKNLSNHLRRPRANWFSSMP